MTPRIQSALPEAVEAIRCLHARGYRLHTASGEQSYDLEGYLRGTTVGQRGELLSSSAPLRGSRLGR